jgi:hypothetical protein
VSNEIKRESVQEPILAWTVWFQTPLGCFETLPEAVKVVQEIGISPQMAIVPVVVVKGATTHEQWPR